jgi:hypothetical protein
MVYRRMTAEQNDLLTSVAFEPVSEPARPRPYGRQQVTLADRQPLTALLVLS